MSDFKGKGSNPRPYDKDKFNDSFDKIFGTKDKQKQKEKEDKK